MASASYVLPLFVAGNEATIIAAVQEGGALADLTGVSYAYAKDTHKFSYIDTNHVIHWVTGDNAKQVQRVSALPAEADLETLYILNNTVYLWNTELEAYVPTYHDVTSQIEALNEAVGTLNTTVAGLVSDMADRPTRDEVNSALTNAIGEANAYTDGLFGPLNETVTGLSSEVTQLQNDLTSNVAALQNSIDTNVNTLNNKIDTNVSALETSIVSTESGIRADMATMQTQIDSIGSTAQEAEQQIVIVQQEAKDYTDQKNEEVITYVNDNFTLREI